MGHGLHCSAQGSNPGLPHCRQILYQLSHKGSLQGSPVWQALAGHKRRIPLAVPRVEEGQWQRPCHDELGTPAPGAGGMLEEGRVTRISRSALLYPGSCTFLNLESTWAPIWAPGAGEEGGYRSPTFHHTLLCLFHKAGTELRLHGPQGRHPLHTRLLGIPRQLSFSNVESANI